jgi:hypothetical protein
MVQRERTVEKLGIGLKTERLRGEIYAKKMFYIRAILEGALYGGFQQRLDLRRSGVLLA